MRWLKGYISKPAIKASMPYDELFAGSDRTGDEHAAILRHARRWANYGASPLEQGNMTQAQSKKDVQRLRALAREEEATGAHEIAVDFRRRADEIDATHRGDARRKE
jgi:hypothetical protein